MGRYNGAAEKDLGVIMGHKELVYTMAAVGHNKDSAKHSLSTQSH